MGPVQIRRRVRIAFREELWLRVDPIFEPLDVSGRLAEKDETHNDPRPVDRPSGGVKRTVQTVED
jgi:hypothetical protein